MVHLIHTVEHVQNNLLLPFGGAGQEQFSRTDGQMRVDECYCSDPLCQSECGQPFNKVLREYQGIHSDSFLKGSNSLDGSWRQIAISPTMQSGQNLSLLRQPETGWGASLVESSFGVCRVCTDHYYPEDWAKFGGLEVRTKVLK